MNYATMSTILKDNKSSKCKTSMTIQTEVSVFW